MSLSHAEKAFNELRAIGAPVFMGDWGGHFNISAEQAGRDDYSYKGEKNNAPSGLPWADYYEIAHFDNHFGYEFGVAPEIIAILRKHNLFCEWYNPAVLCVHDV